MSRTHGLAVFRTLVCYMKFTKLMFFGFSLIMYTDLPTVMLSPLIIRRYGFAANNTAESSCRTLKQDDYTITQQMVPLVHA